MLIEEHYLNDYYRVLVIRDNDKYIVSVDVYRAEWKYQDYFVNCINEVCLLFKEIENLDISIDLNGVEKIIVIGSRVKDKYETINVKWILNHKPSQTEVEKIYQYSWKIIL